MDLRGDAKTDLLPLLEVLTRVTEMVGASEADLRTLFGELAVHVRRVIDCEGFGVFLTVGGSKPALLELRYAEGLPGPPCLRVPFGQHLVGHAAAERTAVIANDVSKDPRYLSGPGSTHAEMAVPLLARGRCVGVVDLQATCVDAFGDREQHIAELVASRVALALDNAHLVADLTRQNHVLATLLEVSHEFSTLLDVNALMDVVATVMRRLIRYDSYAVFLLDEGEDAVPTLRHFAGYRHGRREGLESVSIDEGAIGAAVRTRRPVLVSHALADPDHDSTRGDVRSEVAVPLRLRDRVMGVLALESEREDFFTQRDAETLQVLGSQLAAAIENARLHGQTVQDSAALKADLTAARRIQRQLLLPRAPECQGIEFVAFNQPARALSGDFYDFYPSVEGPVAMLLGDVSGKGAPAALYGALVLGLFRSLQCPNQAPAELLHDVNEALVRRQSEPSTYAAAAFAQWSPARKELVVVNSGAPRPLVLRRGTERYLDATGVPLGMFQGTEYEQIITTLEVGDTLILASDGVFESRDPSGREFGSDRVAEVVRSCGEHSARDVLDVIVAALQQHTAGAAIHDDQTIVIMRVTGPS